MYGLFFVSRTNASSSVSMPIHIFPHSVTSLVQRHIEHPLLGRLFDVTIECSPQKRAKTLGVWIIHVKGKRNETVLHGVGHVDLDTPKKVHIAVEWLGSDGAWVIRIMNSFHGWGIVLLNHELGGSLICLKLINAVHWFMLLYIMYTYLCDAKDNSSQVCLTRVLNGLLFKTWQVLMDLRGMTYSGQI